MKAPCLCGVENLRLFATGGIALAERVSGVLLSGKQASVVIGD